MLIALFLLAAVGGVAFGIGRLFLIESTLSGIYENSTISYYAAESGLEEGLLRYRYQKNQELPVNVAGAFSPSFMQLTTLDWGTEPLLAVNRQATNYDPADPIKHFYGLQVSYLGSSYGTANLSDLNTAGYQSRKEYQLPRDEAIKIDISTVNPDLGLSDIDLFIKTDTSQCAATYGESNSFIEAKVTGKIAGGEIGERKVALWPVALAAPSDNRLPPGNTVGADKIKVYKNLLTNIRNSYNNTFPLFISANAELSLHAVGCSAWFGIKPVSSTAKIAQPYNIVKSKGYYGNVTRTLEAKIDRQAGTVYDLFDYVLYDAN